MATAKKSSKESSLDARLCELQRYNSAHHTHLSYGKYQELLYREQCKHRRHISELTHEGVKYSIGVHIATQELQEIQEEQPQSTNYSLHLVSPKTKCS